MSLRIFDPETHVDEASVLAVLGRGPASIRQIGNRLRRHVIGVRVGPVVRRLARAGVIEGRRDASRNAWVYSIRPPDGAPTP